MSVGSKLGLGTVQWGMRYGLANVDGMPSLSVVEQILDYAHQEGITLLDTATVYGDAECVLGSLSAGARGFEIVTKTCPIGASSQSAVERLVADEFLQSLERMRCPRVYALLSHRAEDLLSPLGDFLWRAFQSLRAQGLVEKIGVSVYHPDDLKDIVARYPIDIVQLPLNIYDQRFLRSGLLADIKSRGVEIHVRSAFLQGLLLMPARDLPRHFGSIREHHEILHRMFARMNLTPLEATLGYCLNHEEVDRVIVGCETEIQLRQIINAARKVEEVDMEKFAGYAVDDEDMVVPSNWPAVPPVAEK